jgi:symplekin
VLFVQVYDRTKDQRLLISILRGMSKSETIAVLPGLLALEDNLLQEVFTRILGGGGAKGGPTGALSPSEFLVALHNPAIKLSDAVRAVNRCLDKRYAHVYTHEVLAVSLQQLVDQTPLPVNLMRTTMQSLGAVPRLKSFVVSLLARLSTKEIWTDPKLWKGFVRLCVMTTKESCVNPPSSPFSWLCVCVCVCVCECWRRAHTR